MRKITTIELQLAGGGPAYWILFDVEGEGLDYTISNIRFKYAWWSEPELYKQMNTLTRNNYLSGLLKNFVVADVSWLESYN